MPRGNSPTKPLSELRLHHRVDERRSPLLRRPVCDLEVDVHHPSGIDGPAWHPEEDRFMYNGGQELVPVDTAAMSHLDAAAAGGTPPGVPTEVDGWQQYRARVEGGFMRFFRSPDSERWIVQSKDGTRFDFGRLPAGEGPGEVVTASVRALERDPELTSGGVYQWALTRMSDSHGSTVYYLRLPTICHRSRGLKPRTV